MNKINFHSNVLFVEDIERAKAFYTNVLMFEIEHDFGTNISFDNGLSIWQIHPEHIIKQKKVDSSTPSNRMELYFETNNIKETFDALQDKEIHFLHEIIEEPWGQKTMRFFDPDKHMIEIGESLETFVKRMANEGMTVDEVSEKTGIPKFTVEELIELE